MHDSSGSLLSDQAAILSRWKEHFAMLLNRPVPPPPLSLVNAAAEAVVDESISIVPPTLPEVYAAIKKIKGRLHQQNLIPYLVKSHLYLIVT